MIELQALVVLVRRWRWIAAGIVAGVLVMSVWTVAGSRAYTATVDIVPNRSRTEVDYETRIKTVSGESNATGGQAVSASAERRLALVSLVRVPDIEVAVREALANEIPASYLEPGVLLSAVQGRVNKGSELFSIVVTAPTPTIAQRIAGAWSTAYEQHVNQLYGGAGLRTEAELRSQVAGAQSRYAVAEQALTVFLGAEKLAEHIRLLERGQQLLNDQQLYMQELARTLRRTELVLGDAQSLQQHLLAARDNGAASTNVSVITLLKMQAFTELMFYPTSSPAQSGGASGQTPTVSLLGPSSGGSSGSAQSGIQVQLGPAGGTPSLAQQRDDIDAVIHALGERRRSLQSELQRRTSGADVVVEGAAEGGQSTGQLEQEIRELQAKISDLAARHRTMQQERDLALETYTRLLKKAEEARVTASFGSSKEVSIVNRTVLAAPAQRSSVVQGALIGAGVGGALGAAAALAIHFFPGLYSLGMRDAERRAQVNAHSPAQDSNGQQQKYSPVRQPAAELQRQ